MRYETTARAPGAFTWARGLSVLLGIWLIISAYAWRHTGTLRDNAVICGVLVIVFALASLRDARARFVNTLVGVWLVLSTFVLGGALEIGSRWNELFVGIALVALSLVRGTESDEPVEEKPSPHVST